MRTFGSAFRGVAVLGALGVADGATADATSIAAPVVLDVSPPATFPGGQALLTLDGAAPRRVRVHLGRRLIPRRDVRAETAADGSSTRLHVDVPRRIRDGDYVFRVRTKAGVGVAPKALSVIKCTILPAPIDVKPLGSKVTLTATMRGPGGVTRTFKTPYVHVFPPTIAFQACDTGPQDGDLCVRTINITLGYPPASTTLGPTGLFSVRYDENDLAAQGPTWSAGGGQCQITLSTATRIGGYFTATIESANQQADDIVPRFTIEGSFVVERP